MQAQSIAANERDVMIRTILGEAASEGMEGQAAVALVIRNRVEDERYPNSVGGVSLQQSSSPLGTRMDRGILLFPSMALETQPMSVRPMLLM